MHDTLIEAHCYSLSAEKQIENIPQATLAYKSNQFACMLLQAKSPAKSITHFQNALSTYAQIQIQNNYSYTNALYNLGNAYSMMENEQKAIESYEQAYKLSPFSQVKEYTLKDANEIQKLAKTKYCSFDSFICTITNLSVLYSRHKQEEKALQLCELVLKCSDSLCRTEATINMGTILRKLGNYDRAMEYAWNEIEAFCIKDKVTYHKPSIIDCKLIPKCNKYTHLFIVCVKYGTKYGSDYVNKLYHGIQNNFTLKHNFICYTEDASGLEQGIETKPLTKGVDGWWNKAIIFDSTLYPENSKCIYIDLDMIIVGNIDFLASVEDSFATLSTEGLYCELAKEGYNSSIIVYYPKHFSQVCSFVYSYFEQIKKVLVRFDHYLQMIIKNSAYLQSLFSSKIADYVSDCKSGLPACASIVCFPRSPKPHEVKDDWVIKLWV